MMAVLRGVGYSLLAENIALEVAKLTFTTRFTFIYED
jgi:hypothetical protein